MKRALVFLAITFGITYAYDFLVVYPIAQGTAPYASEFLSPTSPTWSPWRSPCSSPPWAWCSRAW